MGAVRQSSAQIRQRSLSWPTWLRAGPSHMALAKAAFCAQTQKPESWHDRLVRPIRSSTQIPAAQNAASIERELWPGCGFMTTRGGEESPSARELRAAVDDVIRESLERNPDRVARALKEVVERCKAEGRYPEDEIDAAAAQLRSELGISRKAN